MPFTETLSPTKIMSLLENSHFSLTVSPTFWNFWRTQCSLLLCSCLSCHTPEHHQHDRSHLQSPPPSVTFCANAMPNGSLLNWNLAKGMMNVLSSRDSIVRGICQNPEWASSFVKLRHLSSSPMFGLLLEEYDIPFCCVQGCEVYTYSGLLAGLLAGLGITTIPEYYSVGSVTLEMTPMSSILWNSVLTASLRGRGTHHGAGRTTDTAPCSNSVMRLFQFSWTLKHIRECSSEICLCFSDWVYYVHWS